MKYIRTYETEEGFLADKDSTSREFRLSPVLYKYSEVGDHILLENDDPRKRGDSTYIEITLDSDAEFSFYIGNKSGDTQTIRDCKVDWGHRDSGSTRLTADDKGFKLSHNYKAGSYSIELYAIEDYSIVGDAANSRSLISHPSSVKRVVLGNSVVSIGTYAFYKCSNLTSIHIPESVTDIGNYALRSCKSLSSIYIPESVTSIGNYAFYYCTSLASVYIPEGVTSIGERVFAYCSSLTSVYIPEGVTSIGERVFEQCSSLTSVNIPEGVTSIGRYAFTYCTSLTSVNIPEGVTSIGEAMFMKCSSLTSISSLNTTAPALDINVFASLPTNGTLHIKPGATGYDAWLSALPSGWVIAEDL